MQMWGMYLAAQMLVTNCCDVEAMSTMQMELSDIRLKYTMAIPGTVPPPPPLCMAVGFCHQLGANHAFCHQLGANHVFCHRTYETGTTALQAIRDLDMPVAELGAGTVFSLPSFLNQCLLSSNQAIQRLRAGMMPHSNQAMQRLRAGMMPHSNQARQRLRAGMMPHSNQARQRLRAGMKLVFEQFVFAAPPCYWDSQCV
jgi:hypothetical protein